MNITKDRMLRVTLTFLMFIIFASSICGLTLCRAVVDSETNPRFTVNFSNDYDTTGINLSYSSIAQDVDQINQLLSLSAISNIEKVEKNSFNSNYDLANLIYFTITDSNNQRLQDFSVVNNIEIVVEYSGENTNTSNDAFCAVFVSLEPTLESQVLSGDYSIFESVNSECRAVSIEATAGSNGLVLTMDAPSDGFIFLLTIGDNESNIGTIILVVGIVICVVLVVLILIAVRSYQLDKRRKRFGRQVKDLGTLESDKKLEDKVYKNVHTNTPVPVRTQKATPSVPSAPSVPKMPKANKSTSQNNDSVKSNKDAEFDKNAEANNKDNKEEDN